MASILGVFEWLGNLGLFLKQVFSAAISSSFEWLKFVRQLDEVGVKSLPLISLAGAAIGGRLQSGSIRCQISSPISDRLRGYDRDESDCY